MDWNQNCYRNLFHRKRRLLARLEGINKKLNMGRNRYLEKQQERLWREYSSILTQEELFWCQKARCDWFRFGDKNTKFFHTSTIIRRKRNKIECVLDDEGQMVLNQERLEGLATSYFEHLYTGEETGERLPLQNCFPKLKAEDFEEIHRDVNDEEIREAVFSMGALKAPGLDGLHPIFYQANWEIVGPSVCRLVREAFSNPEKIQEVNDTAIVLIPKVDAPTSMSQFRPISLYNVVYKVVTKVLASRLKWFMPQLVAPNQCSFIPGHHSFDNIVVAQEIFHTMRKRKGKKGMVAVKIDLEKAYDRLSWEFLKETLGEIGLKEHLIKLIYSCVRIHSIYECVVQWSKDKELSAFQVHQAGGPFVALSVYPLC